MRDNLRAAGLILSLTFKADPWGATWLVVRSPISFCTVLGTAYGLKLLTDAAVTRDLNQVLVAIGVLMLVLLLGRAATEGSLSARATVIEKTSLLIDQRLMEAALAVPGLEHHETPKHRDQLELLRLRRGELGEVVDAISHNLGMLMLTGGSVFLLARIHPLLLLLPVVGVVTLFTGIYAERLWIRSQEQTVGQLRSAKHLFEVATETAAGKEVRVFGLGPTLVERHRRLWTEADRVQNRASWLWTLLYSGGWFLFSSAYVAAIGLVVWLAVHRQATPGDVVMALKLAAGVNQLVQGVVFMAGWLFVQLKTAGRITWLTNYARSSRFGHPDPVPAPERLRHGIRLDNVSFRYPETDSPVISDVSVDIPAGCTVALVGENGAGKSTLIKLLARFYQPTSGRILVDGIDLARIDPTEWRGQMAAGFQDFARFELLARETVGVGDLSRIESEPAVAAALTRAAATDVVASLPDGMSTRLGTTFDEGAELSGGQWQKLALGRAMMREAPLLLVLDEPTASLDTATEYELFERYAAGARRVSARTGAVTVLVSHRFSTVRMADLIIVIDDGKLVEYGSHDQLIAREGLYAELFGLQARAYR
jgi:ABC-type multidrug transport system, ATPase and permease components